MSGYVKCFDETTYIYIYICSFIRTILYIVLYIYISYIYVSKCLLYICIYIYIYVFFDRRQKSVESLQQLWGKISIIVDSNLDNEPVYNEKY